MKQLIKFSALLLIINFSCVPLQREVPEEPHASVSFQVFYDDLSPYGHWTRNPTFGYVWLPMDDPDFLPYSTHGHWVWTDYGWTWVSEYPWGWAPFHYGRWDFDPLYGWFWIPDTIWGPGWVIWSEYPGYYGWAPLRPGISISIVIGGGYHPPDIWWTFCDRKHFGRHDMRDHFESKKKIGRINDGESRIIGNSFHGAGGNQIFLTGPGRDNVQAGIDEPIQQVTIVNDNKPGESMNGNTWNVYHPNIEQTPASKPQPVPRAVFTPDEVRKSHEITPSPKPAITPNNVPRNAEPPKQLAPHNVPQEKRNPNPPPALPAPNAKPHQAAPRNDPPVKNVPKPAPTPSDAPKGQSSW